MNRKFQTVYFTDRKFPFLISLSRDVNPYRYTHSHSGELELQYVLTGEGSYIVNNNIYDIREGSLLIIHRNEFHRVASIGKRKPFCKAGFLLSSSIFNEFGAFKNYASKTLFKCSRDFPHLIQFDVNEQVEAEIAVKSMYKDFSGKLTGWKESIAAGMGRLCVLIERHKAAGSNNKARHICDPVIQGCLDYIEKNLASDLNLNKLSEIVGLTPNYLSSKFTGVVGTNLKDYIIEKRINEAKRKLEENPQSKVIVVALEAGFNDLSHFNHTFKKIVGFTPSEYRRFSRS